MILYKFWTYTFINIKSKVFRYRKQDLFIVVIYAPLSNVFLITPLTHKGIVVNGLYIILIYEIWLMQNNKTRQIHSPYSLWHKSIDFEVPNINLEKVWNQTKMEIYDLWSCLMIFVKVMISITYRKRYVQKSLTIN